MKAGPEVRVSIRLGRRRNVFVRVSPSLTIPSFEESEDVVSLSCEIEDHGQCWTAGAEIVYVDALVVRLGVPTDSTDSLIECGRIG